MTATVILHVNEHILEHHNTCVQVYEGYSFHMLSKKSLTYFNCIYIFICHEGSNIRTVRSENNFIYPVFATLICLLFRSNAKKCPLLDEINVVTRWPLHSHKI